MFYKIIAYVPVDYIEQVKTAMFDAGAGVFDGYDRCAWQVLGVGQFRPLSGATPFIGKIGQTQQVAEYRLELIVPKQIIKQVIKAYKDAHPYEVPAYEVLDMVDLDEW